MYVLKLHVSNYLMVCRTEWCVHKFYYRNVLTLFLVNTNFVVRLFIKQIVLTLWCKNSDANVTANY